MALQQRHCNIRGSNGHSIAGVASTDERLSVMHTEARKVFQLCQTMTHARIVCGAHLRIFFDLEFAVSHTDSSTSIAEDNSVSTTVYLVLRLPFQPL